MVRHASTFSALSVVIRGFFTLRPSPTIRSDPSSALLSIGLASEAALHGCAPSTDGPLNKRPEFLIEPHPL